MAALTALALRPPRTRRATIRRPKRPAVSVPNPEHVSPMLAVDCGAAELPPEPDRFGYEYKWDGMRAVCFWDGRSLRLESRNLLDYTGRYPELHAIGPALGDVPVVLDGEVVALDAADRPSFARLQQRMKLTDPAAIARGARQVPVFYFVFDLLYLNGKPLLDLPLTERRARLEELTLAGPSWQVSPMHAGRAEGAAMLKTARLHDLEGLVAKRLDSTYQPGARSPAWRKIKLVKRQEFIVGGWTDEKGSSRGLGALVLGYYDPSSPGRLRHAGNVGTGFTRADAAWLLPLLERHRSPVSPFAERLPKRGVHFTTPSLVVEVEYRRWPPGGLIQHAAYAGVRHDKDPKDVTADGRACSAA